MGAPHRRSTDFTEDNAEVAKPSLSISAVSIILKIAIFFAIFLHIRNIFTTFAAKLAS